METGRGNNYHNKVIMLHNNKNKTYKFRLKVFNYYHNTLGKKKKQYQ